MVDNPKIGGWGRFSGIVLGLLVAPALIAQDVVFDTSPDKQISEFNEGLQFVERGLKLSSAPNEGVTVSVTADPATALFVRPASLTFDDSTWNVFQTIELRSTVVESTTTVTITYSASWSDWTSSEDVRVRDYETDSRPTIEFEVSEPTSSCSHLTAALGKNCTTIGESIDYGVRIKSPPDEAVVVGITPSNDRLTVSPSQLTIDSSNWSIYQTVTMTGQRYGDVYVYFHRPPHFHDFWLWEVIHVRSPGDGGGEDSGDGGEDSGDGGEDSGDGGEDSGDGSGGSGGGGGGSGGDDEPPSCTLVAPYWSGPSGGFTVMPAPDRTSVRVTCGGTTTEYPAEDGLVTRLLGSTCSGSGLRLTGAAPGGWYWQHGEQNAAVAPFVCSEALGGPRAVVPGGVTADVTDNGTWFRHDTGRLVGIVPHLAGNECSEYVTPYWQGEGGVVIRPAEGRPVRVRVQCGSTYSAMAPSSGGDGLVVELVKKSYCTDDEGNPKQGRLTVTGADPGGWYWISGERNAAVGPLVCADLLDGPAAVDPGGVTSQSTDDGTYFSHDTGKLIGVVPHVAAARDDN